MFDVDVKQILEQNGKEGGGGEGPALDISLVFVTIITLQFILVILYQLMILI